MSFGLPLYPIQQPFDFLQLLRRRFPSLECLQHQGLHRSAEHSLHEVVQQLTLHLLLRAARAVNLRTPSFISNDQTLFGHDLKHLQCRGIAGGLLFTEDALDLPNGLGAASPEDLQDLQFCRSRFGRLRRWHTLLLTKFFVICNEDLRQTARDFPREPGFALPRSSATVLESANALLRFTDLFAFIFGGSALEST